MVKKSPLKKVATGIIVFILAALAFFSFEQAVFMPLVNCITALFDGSPFTFWVILIVSCFLLVYIFKKELPFTR